LIVVIAVIIAAAARMAAAVQPLDDAAECRVHTLDFFALFTVEHAPNAFLQVVQLAPRLSDLRLGVAAGGVVSGPGCQERRSGVIEFLAVRGVVIGLRLDAFGLALQLAQQPWIALGAPLVVPVPATVIPLCIGHVILLSWL
jgi:hypothetical protein